MYSLYRFFTWAASGVLLLSSCGGLSLHIRSEQTAVWGVFSGQLLQVSATREKVSWGRGMHNDVVCDIIEMIVLKAVSPSSSHMI